MEREQGDEAVLVDILTPKLKARCPILFERFSPYFGLSFTTTNFILLKVWG